MKGFWLKLKFSLFSRPPKMDLFLSEFFLLYCFSISSKTQTLKCLIYFRTSSHRKLTFFYENLDLALPGTRILKSANDGKVPNFLIKDWHFCIF